MSIPAGVGIDKGRHAFQRARKRRRAGYLRVQPWGHWKCPECKALIDSQAPTDWEEHQRWHDQLAEPEDQAREPESGPIYETFDSPEGDQHHGPE